MDIVYSELILFENKKIIMCNCLSKIDKMVKIFEDDEIKNKKDLYKIKGYILKVFKYQKS
ncbi:MAG: hypothetical protein RSB12_03545 [Peptostreptococcaceae bacterium]